MTPAICEALWAQALDLEIGLAITVKPEDKAFLLNLLNVVRKGSNDTRLQDLMITQPGPLPTEIWVVKKATELPDG